MFSSRVSFVLALVVSSIGCSRDEAPPPPAYDPATLALIDAAGDRALITAVIRPEGLPRLTGSLGRLLSTLPPPIKQTLTDPRAAIEAAVGALPDRDDDRPVVVALFASPRVGPPGALVPSLPDLTDPESRPPAMRHRVLVPTTNADALVTTLRQRFIERGAKPEGEALRLDRRYAARLFAEGDRVRVEIVDGVGLSVDWSVLGGESARTPALFAAAAPDLPIAVLVRPWHLRAVFVLAGYRQVFEALASASPDIVGRLMVAGNATLLASEVMMHADAAELDDWALTAAASADGARFEVVATLTPAGAAVLDAAGDHAPLAPREGAAATMTTRVDIRAMLGVARPPMAMTGASSLPRAFADCGVGCALHALARHPFGTLAALAKDNDGLMLALAPRSPQIALFGVEAGKPRAALAMQMTADGLERARTFVERTGRGEVQMTTRALTGGMTAVIVAAGVEFDAAFGATVDGTGPLAQFRVAPGAFADAVPASQRATLTTIEAIDGRIDRAGDAIVGQFAIRLVESKASLSAPAPRQREGRGPIVAAPITSASTCLLRAARDMRLAFDALSTAAPEQRVALTANALGELRTDFECAAADPMLAPVVRGMRQMLIAPVIGAELDGWTPGTAMTLLTSLCEAGDEALCARLREIRPAVDLPGVASARCDAALSDGVKLRVMGDAIELGGAPLPAAGEARRTALSRASLMGAIELGVEQSRTWLELRPLIADLAAAGVDRINVVALHDGRAVRIPVRLRDVKPAAPDPDNRFAKLLAESPPPVPGTPLRIGGLGAALPDGRALLPVDIDPATLTAPLALEPSDSASWARVVEYVGAACPQVTLGAQAAAAAPARLGSDAPEMRPATRDREVIRQVIGRNQAAVRSCYQKALVKNPTLAGKVTVRFQVGTSGTVGDVAAEAEGFKAPAVVECVRKAVGEMRFPPAQTTSAVTYPFIFKAR